MTAQKPNTLEYDYRILKMIEERPELSQRAMAEELGISVGRTNYVLSALVERGLVKVENFKKSNNKAGYLYLLTPYGFAEKAKITASFLKRKMAEYELLQQEIEQLKSEASEVKSITD